MNTLPAQDVGPTDVPLLEETIGANLARTVAAHGDVEAIVARPPGDPLDVSRVRRTRRDARQGAARAWGSRPAIGSACGARTTRSGRCCSTPRPRSASSSSTSTPRTARTSWRTCSSSRVVGSLFAAPSFKTSDYVEMVEVVRPEVPALEQVVFFWEADWDELIAGAGRRHRGRSWHDDGPGCATTTRSTSSTRRARPGSRRARRSRTGTS